MRPVDWQAYEDGSMPPAERIQTEELMQNEPAAKAEAEGLTAFKAALKESALKQEAPTIALEAALARTVKRPNRPMVQRYWMFAAAAACLVLFVVAKTLFPAGTASPQTAPEKVLLTSDINLAKTFSQRENSLVVPATFSLASADLTRVHCGAGWSCFDYRYKGKIYHVSVTSDLSALTAPKKTVQGLDFVETGGLGWQHRDLAVNVEGESSDEGEEALAVELARRLDGA